MRPIPKHELSVTYVRSSGPGGQNVNKTNTKAVVRWNPATSEVLGGDMLARFMERFGGKLTLGGELIVTSDRFRDQIRNLEDVLSKIMAMLEEVRVAPKKRKKTRPTKGSSRRRLEGKRVRSDVKKGRGRVEDW
jgi:ribosome-associated protein